MTNKPDKYWVIHDGGAGNRRQAIALAEALAWAYEERPIKPGMVSKWLSPRLLPWIKQPFGEAFANAAKNPPTYVIGCGRQAALATRILKKNGSFAIQILNPRIDSHHWDVVIAPKHDGVQGDNVIQSVGSLHDVNAASLNQWRSENSALARMNSPLTVVLVGGPSRSVQFNEGLIEVMFSHLEYDLVKYGGSLIICGSRRTPKKTTRDIRQRFTESNFPIWFDDSDGENIYRPALAHADRIVVTPDSVNMISEACATNVPVFIAQPERATGRMKMFIDDLLKKGSIRKLSRDLETYPVTALNTMPEVISQLKKFARAV